jgi:hypothetical protein
MITARKPFGVLARLVVIAALANGALRVTESLPSWATMLVLFVIIMADNHSRDVWL